MKNLKQLINTDWIRTLHPDLADQDDLFIYGLIVGPAINLDVDPNPLFDSRYYVEHICPRDQQKLSPLLHFLTHSRLLLKLGPAGNNLNFPSIDPNPYFLANEVTALIYNKAPYFQAILGSAKISDPLSFYINKPPFLNIKVSATFSDYVFRLSENVFSDPTLLPICPLGSFLGSRGADKLKGNRFSYRGRVYTWLLGAERLSSIRSKYCIYISTTESNYPATLNSVRKHLPGSSNLAVIINVVCATICDISADILDDLGCSNNICIIASEDPGSFLYHWRNCFWTVPNALLASGFVFLSLQTQKQDTTTIEFAVEFAFSSLKDPTCEHEDSVQQHANSFIATDQFICLKAKGEPCASNLYKSIAQSPVFASNQDSLLYLHSVCKDSNIHFDSRSFRDDSFFMPSVVISDINYPPLRSIPDHKVTGPIGNIQAFNHVYNQRVAYDLMPGRHFTYTMSSSLAKSTLVVVHCYYPEVSEKIFDLLSSRKDYFFVLATTDNDSKALVINRQLTSRGFDFKVTICTNRGRDVAPMLIESRELIMKYRFFLHLHTKRSPHSSDLSGWSDYLFDALIGSGERIDSCLEAMTLIDSIGILYPHHYNDLILSGLNWGYNYKKANQLLGMLNINIQHVPPLEFPSSTMFWGKTEAIQDLFLLPFKYEDFDDEAGQVDGTYAHAVERVLLYAVEAKGYSPIILASPKHAITTGMPVIRCNVDNLHNWYYKSFRFPSILHSPAFQTHYEYNNYEVYSTPVVFENSSKAPRFNILIPTIEPAHIYGGITTALKVARELYASFADEPVELRILVTSAPVTPKGLYFIQNFFPEANLRVCRPSSDAGSAIVELCIRRHEPLSLRKDDIFFATAWWTYAIADKYCNSISKRYGERKKIIYLIQDYESCFNEWSEKFAICEQTYSSPGNVIPIINSEELASFMLKKYPFENAFCVRFRLNHSLEAEFNKLTPFPPKKKIILVYARPSVKRNLFSLILSALQIWQYMRPDQSSEYQVVMAGEEFKQDIVSDLQNCIVCGKMTLSEYSHTLCTASIGISLMLSPHPSYPPLEMAYFGLKVLTNRYEEKDLSVRSANIVGVDSLSQEAIAYSLSKIIDSLDDHQDSSAIECGIVKDLTLPSGCEEYKPSRVIQKALVPVSS